MKKLEIPFEPKGWEENWDNTFGKVLEETAVIFPGNKRGSIRTWNDLAKDNIRHLFVQVHNQYAMAPHIKDLLSVETRKLRGHVKNFVSTSAYRSELEHLKREVANFERSMEVVRNLSEKLDKIIKL